MEIATAIDRLHPKLRGFDDHYHVVEPQPGVRLLLRENERREVAYVSVDALAGSIMRFCNNSGKARLMLTFSQAKEAALVWLYNATPVEEPPAVSELSAPGLSFHRLPFDMPEPGFETPPLFEEFLSRCSNRLALACFIGSLFDPQSDRQQYVWIHGAGQNGKGALGYVLRRLLGGSFHSENVPDLKRGVSNFWTASFLGKRLVLFPDCNSPQFPQSGLFKALTGGDMARIERKGKDAYATELHCKFMFFSNEELIISSQKADLRRAIYCHVDPIKTQPDGKYYEQLWAEAPRIMRECIDLYRATCAYQGQIPVEDGIEHLADIHDSRFDTFFNRYFAQVDDRSLEPQHRSHISPGDMQAAFIDFGIRNPREQNRHLDYFARVYGVEKIDLRNAVPRRRYVGLKKKAIFMNSRIYDSRSDGEPWGSGGDSST